MEEIPKHDLDRVLEAWSEAKERGEGTTIESLCSGDSNLEHAAKSRIQRLSAIEDALGLDADGSEGEPAFGVGSRIGRYELERYVGEGGFGVVFEASRTDGLLGRFAVKLLSRSMYSRDARARFENECRALTVARHDHIASVIDAGVTDQGVPYLVMNYIEGETLTEHCASEKLDVRGRLRLFLQVCSAVEHAHAKGVIHRDLKPGNMLVESGDAGASLRVIDFGIARVIDDVDQSRERFTQAGDLVGTAAYMSPEQLGVLDSEADTRSDIYSMGVVLYELVCGWLPYQRSINENLKVYELQRRLRETNPTSVSGRRRTAGGAQADSKGEAVLAMPGTAELSLHELNCVVMKCLALEPEHRYATCRELAEEIRRLLDGRPVAAGPQSKRYIVRRFIERNRVATLVTLSALLVISTALAFTSYALISAAREGRRAVLAEEVTREVANFQIRQFEYIDQHSIGSSIRELLLEDLANSSDSASDSDSIQSSTELLSSALEEVNFTDISAMILQKHFFDQSASIAKDQLSPEMYARFLHAIGIGQSSIGFFEEAHSTHEAAVQILTQELGPNHQYTLNATGEYANTLRALGRLDEAEILLRNSLATQISLNGPSAEQSLRMRNDYAMVLFGQGQVEEARDFLQVVADDAIDSIGDTHMLTATIRGNLGDLLDSLGKYEDAERHHIASKKAIQRKLGARHEATILAMNNLSKCLVLQGRYSDALPELERTVSLASEELGKRHQTTMLAQSNLAITLQRTGQYTRALSINSDLLETRLEMHGERNIHSMISMNLQAGLLLRTGEVEEALDLAIHVDSVASSALGPDRYETAIFNTTLAQFVAFFGYSGLGQILAVKGADLLIAMNLDNPLVFLPFILMCCFVNLMLGSASAQWAVTAPIFVPMLMTIGYSPEVIQAAYRIGDSTTNIITPMMSYFGLILAVATRYKRDLGIGTMLATMLPYSIALLIGWTLLFYLWVFVLGLPVGPDAPTTYTLASPS